jgi:hypothetical protein
MSKLTRRRIKDQHAEQWQIFADDIRIGSIGMRPGVPTHVDQWQGNIAPYPASQRGIRDCGTAHSMHLPFDDSDEVHLIENVFDSDQKKQIIQKLTDAMVSVEGENMRNVTLGKAFGGHKRRVGRWRSAINDRSGQGACREQEGRLRARERRASSKTDCSGGLAKEQGRIGGELESVQIIIDGELGPHCSNCAGVGARLLYPACERVTEGGHRKDQDVRVRLHRRLGRPGDCLIKLSEPHMGHCPATEHAKQKRIERA